MSNATIWGLHAGRTGEAHELFLQKNVVAIGWAAMGDLSTIPANREAFKLAFCNAYPDTKPGAAANGAGQPYRFVHEMKPGDLIAYPSKSDKLIHVGQIDGPYFYRPDGMGYRNQRSVKWLRAIPRQNFSQGALYEIGSAMSLFQIKNYSDEFRAILEGKQTVVSIEEDASVATVQANIEETTSDYLVKKLAQVLKGHPFAHFVAHLLNTMGYRTRGSPEGTDGGIDIIAHRDELGFEPPIIKVQVKSGENKVSGDPEVKALYGNVDPKEFGLFITLGSFTNQARQFARGKANLRLIEQEELLNLILSHYEQFDSHFKSILRLKQIYVPDPEEPSKADLQ